MAAAEGSEQVAKPGEGQWLVCQPQRPAITRPSQAEEGPQMHQPQEPASSSSRPGIVQLACGAFAKMVHLHMCIELPQAVKEGQGSWDNLVQAAVSNGCLLSATEDAWCLMQRWYCILGTRGTPQQGCTARSARDRCCLLNTSGWPLHALKDSHLCLLLWHRGHLIAVHGPECLSVHGILHGLLL